MLQNLLHQDYNLNYNDFFNKKIEAMLKNLSKLQVALPQAQCFKSDPIYYRMRSEFSIFQTQDSFDYIMFEKINNTKQRIIVNTCPIHSKAIDELMSPLKELICQHQELKSKLFEIDFLANQQDQIIVCLCYHKTLANNFIDLLKTLKSQLRAQKFKVDIIARAKKQFIQADIDYVIETYHLQDGSKLKLKQVEGTFSQPNAKTCTHMLDFARDCVKQIQTKDLLELYCGSGTFTVALAPFFNKVLATEVARVPTQTALFNLQQNNINNTKLVRLSAQEVKEALLKIRDFRRLTEQKINLDEYDFTTTFIDPPRSGLQDEQALAFTAKYDNIIYISCGKESFINDLKVLTKTHEIKKLAFFDQFPYTEHLESGALLVRK